MSKKLSPKELRSGEYGRCSLIYSRNTIRNLMRAREEEIKRTDGVYDDIWIKYRDDLRLATKLIREYDKLLDEQGVYHSNSDIREGDDGGTP